MYKDPQNAFYHYINVICIHITHGETQWNVDTGFCQGWTFVAMHFVFFQRKRIVLECSETEKSPNATVKVNNNIASCACVCVSVCVLGRFQVIKQQDSCSDRHASKMNLMTSSLLLLEVKWMTNRKSWTGLWIGTGRCRKVFLKALRIGVGRGGHQGTNLMKRSSFQERRRRVPPWKGSRVFLVYSRSSSSSSLLWGALSICQQLGPQAFNWTLDVQFA